MDNASVIRQEFYIAELKQEIEDLRIVISRLKKIIEDLKAKDNVNHV